MKLLIEMFEITLAEIFGIVIIIIIVIAFLVLFTNINPEKKVELIVALFILSILVAVGFFAINSIEQSSTTIILD